MAAPTDPANLDHAIQLYLAGESLQEIRSRTGVGASVLHRVRKARGIPPRPTNSLDPQRVIAAYLAGASENAIAQEAGISRGPVERILRIAGIPRRGCSEAGKLRAEQMTPDERRAQAAAANAASRGRMPSLAEKCRRAVAREARGGCDSAGERRLWQHLSELGLTPTPQRAIGKYNVDLTVAPVAVEVLGGAWHAYKPEHAERIPYILDQGWHLVMVWDGEGSRAIGCGAADYIIAFHDQVRRNPPATSQYRVIAGDGKLLAACGREDDEFPVVRASRRSLKLGA